MSEKVVPIRIYLLVFAILAVLALVTYQIAFINLGRMNTVIALAIAVSKAILVALYFMHVRYSTRLTWAVIGGGLFWLGIMIVLVMSDYLTRSWLRYPN